MAQNDKNPLAPLNMVGPTEQDMEYMWNNIVKMIEKDRLQSPSPKRTRSRLQGIQTLMAGLAAVLILGGAFLGVTRGGWLTKTVATNKPVTPNHGKVTTPIHSIRNLTEIHMVDASDGWAVETDPTTKQSILLKSSDGGHTWKNVTPSFITGHPNQVQQYKGLVTDFLDAEHAYVAFSVIKTESNGAMTDVPTVYVTSDGGKTWSSATMPETDPNFVPVYVHFNTPSFGIALNEFDTNGGDGWPVRQLYQTTDGGRSWHVMAQTPPRSSIPRTVSPGEMPSINPVQGLTWVKMVNQQVGFTPGQPSTSDVGVNQNTVLYKTVDGGRTWNPIFLPIAKPKDLASVVILVPSVLQNGNIIVPVIVNYGSPATEYRLGLYQSTDSGNTFSQISQKNVAPNNTVYFGGFIDAFTGWFWLGGNVLTTTDGGKSFSTTLFRGASPATSVQFMSRTTGYVATPDGLWQTTDGGLHWTEVSSAIH